MVCKLDPQVSEESPQWTRTLTLRPRNKNAGKWCQCMFTLLYQLSYSFLSGKLSGLEPETHGLKGDNAQTSASKILFRPNFTF